MKMIFWRLLMFVVMVVVNSLNGNNDECIEFSAGEVFAPWRLGDITLYKDACGFHVSKDNQIFDIKPYFCDKLLREMSDAQLEAFLGRHKLPMIRLTAEELTQIDSDELVEITGPEKERLMQKLFGGGYIQVGQMSDGEYCLQAKMRLLGGGNMWRFFTWVVCGAVVIGLLAATAGAIAAAGAAGYAAKGLVVGALLGGGAGVVEMFQGGAREGIPVQNNSTVPEHQEQRPILANQYIQPQREIILRPIPMIDESLLQQLRTSVLGTSTSH